MNINDLANAQAEQEDYTKPESGGNFERELPVAGHCVMRLREYVELGVHSTATKAYPKKKPAAKARFVFELTTPKHVKEVENSEGSKKRFGQTMAISCVISKSEKSNYMKLFKQLNYAGEAKVPAQCLGKAYMGFIVHAYDKADIGSDGKPAAGAKPKWANLQKDGVYTVEPPRVVDPLAETITEIKVPEMLGDMKLFLWNMPTQECWDSLFIDGEYERETDGKTETVSKNWMQNLILSALNYEGSPLQEMLMGEGESLADLPGKTEPEPTAADALSGLMPDDDIPF